MDQDQIRNLLKDESFINYCLDRNVADKQYWENYIRENPDQSESIHALKHQIVSLGRYARKRNLSDRIMAMKNEIRRGEKRTVGRRYRMIGVAASIFIIAVAGVMLHQRSHSGVNQMEYTSPTLLLANGKAINLDSVALGSQLDLGDLRMEKNDEGQLVYHSLDSGDIDSKVVFHSLIVPAGVNYEVVLPDQSVTLVNAKSVLQFPSHFYGNKRVVKLSGEALFQVKKNVDRPFMVEAGDLLVTVIGTTFNVSAYGDDDEVIATLVEGKVSVKHHDQEIILVPGQQARVGNFTTDILLQNVELDEVLAWKDRKLVFRNEKFPVLIKRLGRWYDVEFVYHGSNQQRYNGVLSLDKSLEELMSILQETSPLTYRIEPTENNLKERRVIIE